MNLSPLARKRLGLLVRFMERRPPEARKHFSMAAWFQHDSYDHDHDFAGEYIQPGDVGKCGTTACALGWAAIIPSFRRDGLKVVRAVGTLFDYSNERNLDTAVVFFDIDRATAEQVFGYGEVPTRAARTPKQWARAVRELLDLPKGA